MPQIAIDETNEFIPRFNEDGLIPCIATSIRDGTVLMFAWMNKEAMDLSLETGEAHYWSRSRKALWRKGENSGMVQRIVEMRIDCDQDCLWISVDMPISDGIEQACHTGRRSCFYRRVGKGGSLTFV